MDFRYSNFLRGLCALARATVFLSLTNVSHLVVALIKVNEHFDYSCKVCSLDAAKRNPGSAKKLKSANNANDANGL